MFSYGQIEESLAGVYSIPAKGRGRLPGRSSISGELA